MFCSPCKFLRFNNRCDMRLRLSSRDIGSRLFVLLILCSSSTVLKTLGSHCHEIQTQQRWDDSDSSDHVVRLVLPPLHRRRHRPLRGKRFAGNPIDLHRNGHFHFTGVEMSVHDFRHLQVKKQSLHCSHNCWSMIRNLNVIVGQLFNLFTLFDRWMFCKFQ